MLPCTEIAREIEQNLDFLESTLRDVPARHHSLRAVFDHSWNLLTAEEQHAFPRLAVFQGGFTRTAAADVAGVRLPLLLALADKSLLHVTGEGRYTLHEVLRQYALERLATDPRAETDLRARHCRVTLAFLECQAARLHSPEQLAALAEVEREIENIRAAWVWAADHVDVANISRGLIGLVSFYEIRNWPEEAEDALGRAVSALGTASEVEAQHVRAHLLAVQAFFAGYRGVYERAADLTRQCIDLAQRSGARLALAWGQLLAIAYLLIEDVDEVRRTYAAVAPVIAELDQRANVVTAALMVARRLFWQDGKSLETRDHLYPALAISRELGDYWLQGHCLLLLGVVAYSVGEFDEACRLHSEALRIRRDLGDKPGIARALVHLGEATMRLGRYAEAERLFDEALASARMTGDRQYAAVCLDCLGYISYLKGAYAVAQQQFEEGLWLREASDDPGGIPWTLFNLGNVALVRGELAAARQYYHEARSRFQGTNSPWGAQMTLKKLGEVELAAGDFQLAEETLRAALSEAVAQTRMPEVVETLVILADLHQRQGRLTEAMAFLNVTRQHAAITPDVRVRAEHLVEQVASELSPTQAATTLAPTSPTTLEELVNAYG
jgi:tetratricopeptide (TPR) repeat protein